MVVDGSKHGLIEPQAGHHIGREP